MTEIKIKEHDLYKITKDLMDAALSINRPNKTKICKFIVELVENGGHITCAAMAAGFGPNKNKSGKELTEQETRKIAGNEGSRLLENEGIASVYEKLHSHRIMGEIFRKSFTKTHVINLMYQVFMMHCEDNPRQAITALKEAATLEGHYNIAEKDLKILSEDEQAEVVNFGKFIERFSREKQKEAAMKPAISSEVYN